MYILNPRVHTLSKLAEVSDSRLTGTCLFSSIVLIFFQYVRHAVRPDFIKLPIGIYTDKRVYSAIMVMF